MMMTFPKYESYKDSGVEWLGEIPSHWQVSKLKHSIQSATNGIWGSDVDDDDENDGVVCIRVADFTRQNLRVSLERLTRRKVSDSEFQSRRLSPGDLLLEKSGGGDNQLVGQVVLFEHDIPAVCSNFLARLRVADNFDSSFLNYVHASLYALRINYKHIKQTTGIQNIDGSSYLSELFAHPDLEEQQRIVEFLDRTTTDIDRAISQKQRLIELLQEQKAILINQAVTKGLNPNVPMQDSGVDWLGEIPDHWNVSRIGFIGKVGNGSTPNRSNLAYWNNGSIPWLNSSKVNETLIYSAEQFVTEKAVRECHLPIVKPDSIVLAITGEGKTRGTAAICKIETTINQHIAYIEVLDKRVSPEFLLLYLQAMYVWMRTESSGNGSTKGAITCDDIKKYKVPVPPIDEQKRLLEGVSQRFSDLEELLEKTFQSVEKLNYLKQVFISNAVTGKIKV